MMDEMLNYIFSSMRSSEKMLRGVRKVLVEQRSFNRNVILYAVITTAYILANESKRLEQDKKIAKLSKEVEELKGEQVMK